MKILITENCPKCKGTGFVMDPTGLYALCADWSKRCEEVTGRPPKESEINNFWKRFGFRTVVEQVGQRVDLPADSSECPACSGVGSNRREAPLQEVLAALITLAKQQQTPMDELVAMVTDKQAA